MTATTAIPEALRMGFAIRRQDVFLVVFGDGIDDGGERRSVAEEMLFGNVVA